jgi:hypothetical protein
MLLHGLLPEDAGGWQGMGGEVDECSKSGKAQRKYQPCQQKSMLAVER